MTLTAPASALWTIPSFSIDTLSSGWVAPQAAMGTAVAWGTANRAIYSPVRVPRACVVRELAAGVGSTATGNIDIGLYTVGGIRLVSAGSQTKLASQMQVVDVTDTTIGPGLYYLGLNNDTTTDTFVAWNDGAPLASARGTLAEAVGAVTLPSTATWAFDHTLTFQPLVAALLITELA